MMRPESGENPTEEKQDPLSGKEGSDKDSGDGDASSSSSGAKNQGEGGHGVEVSRKKNQTLRIQLLLQDYNLVLFVESEHRGTASATIHCDG